MDWKPQHILSKINNLGARDRILFENILSSSIIKIISIISSFLLIPVSIELIGVEKYGIWVTISSIISWFSFFDIGLGHGLKNKLAEAVAQNNTYKAKGLISTAYIGITLPISILWIIFNLLNNILDWNTFFNTKIYDESLNNLFFIVTTFFCLQFVLRLLISILIAYQKVAIVALIDSSIQFLIVVTLFFTVKLHPISNLHVIASVTGYVQVIILSLCTIYFFKYRFRSVLPTISSFKVKFLNSLFGLGIKFFLIQVAGIFIFQMTNVIIIKLLNPSSVTIFSIVYKYFSISTMLVSIITAPLWPAVTEAFTKMDLLWLKKTFNKLHQLWIIICLLILFLFSISYFIYPLFLDNKVVISWQFSLLMAVNMILMTRLNIYINIINGFGKVNFQLYLNVGLSFIYIPLSYFLTTYFNLYGTLFANIFINLVYAILVPWQAKLIILNKANGVFNK